MYRCLSTAVAARTKKTRTSFASGQLPWLFVMSDAVRLPHPEKIVGLLPNNSAVIVRHTDIETKREILQRVMNAKRSRRIKVLVSGNWRLAAALRCDGVHIPEHSAKTIAPGMRLWLKAKRQLFTTSAHGLNGLVLAKRNNAHVVLLSPVLPTPSHAGAQPLGRFRFAMLTRRVKTPIAAMGGIQLSTLNQLNGARICAVAGISFAAERN